MQQTNWLVVTGAPSSGKTAVINCLARMGYPVKPEGATLYISGQQALGRTLQEICADQCTLQEEISLLTAQMEDRLDHTVPHVLDRAVPDVLAYCRLYQNPEDGVLSRITRRYYPKVMLLSRLPFVANDVRIENDGIASDLDGLFEMVYRELGYDVVRIPVFAHADMSLPQEERITWSVERRVEHILRHWNA